MTAEHVNVSLRAATAGDVDAIAALHVASWLAAYSGIVPDAFLSGVTLESRVVRWGQAVDPSVSPHTETVVAEEGGTILGVCSFGPRRQPAGDGVGEVYALHVRPDVRRERTWKAAAGPCRAAVDRSRVSSAACCGSSATTRMRAASTRHRAGRSPARNLLRTAVATRSPRSGMRARQIRECWCCRTGRCSPVRCRSTAWSENHRTVKGAYR